MLIIIDAVDQQDRVCQQLAALARPQFTCRYGDSMALYLPDLTSVPDELQAANIQVYDSPGAYPLVSRTSGTTVVEINGVPVGGATVQIMAGPCSVETAEQMQACAETLNDLGIQLLRGGAFKPRTSPYAFQGLGEPGLKLMKTAATHYGLGMITELMDVRLLDTFIEQGVDAIQIGSRNMQNFDLLKAVGETHLPVILKRGLAATIKEWLLAAEYIASRGNGNIILCERGIRGFENSYRNMLDISAIPFVKQQTRLPVIVDPSHAAGKVELIAPLSKAAIAAGADGLMIEFHPRPAESYSDKEQALSPDQLIALHKSLKPVCEAVDRGI